jgi:hypothetical protein
MTKLYVSREWRIGTYHFYYKTTLNNNPRKNIFFSDFIHFKMSYLYNLYNNRIYTYLT